jgi:hypothetical protein
VAIPKFYDVSNMQRRGFLAAMLASGMAPAIVRADSLMRLFVPSRGLILPSTQILGFELVDPATNTWRITGSGTDTFDSGKITINWE